MTPLLVTLARLVVTLTLLWFTRRFAAAARERPLAKPVLMAAWSVRWLARRVLLAWR